MGASREFIAMKMRGSVSVLLLGVVSAGGPAWMRPARGADGVADANAPAVFRVTDSVIRPRDQVPPLGVNNWGGCGAIEWAANNFVRNSGNEPVYWRNMHRAKNIGPNWFEIDGPGTSWWDLWNSGLLSGAALRVYRLVDIDGNPLPEKGDSYDADKADHVEFVGRAQIAPAGATGFPDGGWIANAYCHPFPNGWIRHGNLTATDASGLENGRTYWYTVVAVGTDNQESSNANEASATPRADALSPPRVLITADGDKVPVLKPRTGMDFTPKVFGGKPPYQWQLLDAAGQPLTPPAGLTFDAASGRISGTPEADLPELRVQLQVADSAGRRDARAYWFNAPAPPPSGQKQEKPLPPQDVTAVAGDGCVTISWKPSPSPGVVAYRLKRSTAPAAEQMQRAYLAEGGPTLEKWDYIVLERRFDTFDMKYVSPRVRGMGNAMDAPDWYWRAEPNTARFSLVPHPQPIPSDLADPGETCLQVTAQAGQQTIGQFVFIGTKMGGESTWYGQLEPGQKYRLEVWLRQEGLADAGAVRFSFGRGYPDLQQAFQVTDAWKRCTYDFTGPERPDQQWHFGHQFTFTGPGMLWMDNCRICRVDKPEDADKPYVPNGTVLRELMASQPESGPKGAHRIWFLNRDATMKSLLSWHANSRVGVDWRTVVEGTTAMTVPMGLTFDLHTGPDPQSRMRPWLVLQHLLHTEDDWLALIEYLSAPFDPQRDSPQSKPWAHLRVTQRGVATPWTDEFPEIIIEFGNETWHNGLFGDWLGFRTFGAVHQGGPEYGCFARYLIETMQKSPHWKSQQLDRKLRFTLGGNYEGRVDSDGTVRGYVEEAMQKCPPATLAGHANYVGPKWETGDASSGHFDDHGVQETLLAFLTGPDRKQLEMMRAREALATSHHAYDLAAYEGGPSGYALPGQDSPQQKEANEKYGKSLAMAVAAMDAWLRSYAYGWTDQCFWSYGQGTYWNSHTPLWDGFRPTPGWQALTLRNRRASGDLMKVEERSVPTFERAGGKQSEIYPLAGAYALRDGTRWTVILVSRKLDGRHDGTDFGDGHTPVTLQLPFRNATKVALHTLTGDPRHSNRERLTIVPQSKELPADTVIGGMFTVDARTGGSSNGLPPGSIFLYVFDVME